MERGHAESNTNNDRDIVLLLTRFVGPVRLRPGTAWVFIFRLPAGILDDLKILRGASPGFKFYLSGHSHYINVYQTAPPTNLPDIWPEHVPLSPQAQAPPGRQPIDKEAVPPIPAQLHDQECLYGYFITDQLLETYWTTHPDTRPARRMGYPITYTIYRVAKQFGLDIWIDRKRAQLKLLCGFRTPRVAKSKSRRYLPRLAWSHLKRSWVLRRGRSGSVQGFP
ncbi:hypothetical protein DFH09DRAFT_1467390 [Mycena vulgaris]|nr:hypothetical protein DFH09DRAFT_1467390 [Mycena vulgaris]